MLNHDENQKKTDLPGAEASLTSSVAFPPDPIKEANREIVRLICEKATLLRNIGLTREEAYAALIVSPEVVESILEIRYGAATPVPASNYSAGDPARQMDYEMLPFKQPNCAGCGD